MRPLSPDLLASAVPPRWSGTEKAARMFAALSAGGQVQMPMGKTFFAPAFGMVTDKFGVMWMVLTEA